MTALPPGHGRAGAQARLSREGGAAVAAAMTASPNHVARPERWMRQAREQQPELDGGQAAELADQLRAEYFRKVSAAGVAARQKTAAARQAARPEVIAMRCGGCGMQWEVPARPDGTMPANVRCRKSRGGCGRQHHVPRLQAAIE